MIDSIEATTSNWFEDTVSKVNSRDYDGGAVDTLLSSVVPVAYNYCNAVFKLADNHALPAMALLRVLGELAITTLWCMYSENPRKESPEVRISRWLKTTNKEEIKLLKKVLLSADTENAKDIQQTIDYLQTEIEENKNRFTGGFYNLLNELPSVYKTDIYPILYGQFNRAIHPNLKLLADLIKKENNKLTFLMDLEGDAASIEIYSMTAAFNILAVVRAHYHWEYKVMKEEYLAIKKKYAS